MYITIDIGGTNVRISGSKSLDNIVLDDVQRFELTHDFEKDFQRIIENIEMISNGNVQAIGIGMTGTYDQHAKLLISAKHLPEWVDAPFAEKLSQKFDCDVFVNNDAVVASLAEAYYGQVDGRDFIYVTWGTGAGGAQVKFDTENVTAEKIDWNLYFAELDEKCGGNGIAKRFGKPAQELDENQWDQIMDDFIFYLSDIAEKTGRDCIVLGGGATTKQKLRLLKVVECLADKKVHLYISDLNDEVGLYGALALIRSNEKSI